MADRAKENSLMWAFSSLKYLFEPPCIWLYLSYLVKVSIRAMKWLLRFQLILAAHDH